MSNKKSEGVHLRFNKPAAGGAANTSGSKRVVSAKTPLIMKSDLNVSKNWKNAGGGRGGGGEGIIDKDESMCASERMLD